MGNKHLCNQCLLSQDNFTQIVQHQREIQKRFIVSPSIGENIRKTQFLGEANKLQPSDQAETNQCLFLKQLPEKSKVIKRPNKIKGQQINNNQIKYTDSVAICDNREKQNKIQGKDSYSSRTEQQIIVNPQIGSLSKPTKKQRMQSSSKQRNANQTSGANLNSSYHRGFTQFTFDSDINISPYSKVSVKR